MLVLSRKQDEEVLIDGETIVVSIVEIRHDKVRIGFQAPRDWFVDRLPVYEAVMREKAAAVRDGRPYDRRTPGTCRGLLVLTQARGDVIVVWHRSYLEWPNGVRPEDQNIRITTVDLRGDKVRVGFEAPLHISVHRREVYDGIQRENKQRLHDDGPTPAA